MAMAPRRGLNMATGPMRMPDLSGPMHAHLGQFRNSATAMQGHHVLGRATPATHTNPAPVMMRRGGQVPGRGSSDTVPAKLTPGEFVVNRNAAAANRPALQAMNRRTPPPPARKKAPVTPAAGHRRGGFVRGYRTGGTVTIEPTKKGQRPLKFQAGGLHASTGTKPGQKISAAKHAAARSGKLGKRAKAQEIFYENVLSKRRK